jgi:uncharacterized protein YndB with AHSA1/START domain
LRNLKVTYIFVTQKLHFKCLVMDKTIKKEWIYEQSPEIVWEYLTQSDLLALWLMPNNFKPVVGHEFEFRTKPMPNINLDGIMHCKVLEMEPVKKLVYSWKAGAGDGEFSLDTIVHWTLEKIASGTKLTLVQSGFKDHNQEIFIGMTDGWEQLVQKMVNHIKQQMS